nr:hypothetical protein [Citrobacter farmeri]
MLKGYDVILVRDFFLPANRRCRPEQETSWLIICDEVFSQLMRSLFQGRHFLLLDTALPVNEAETEERLRNGIWEYNKMARPLTMSEMVVIFSYVYMEWAPDYLAREMGISVKTVNSFLYRGLAKNGRHGVSVKHLVSGLSR